MKILIPFTASYKRFHRIKKHIEKREENRRRLEKDALEYAQNWYYSGFFSNKALLILRKYYS